MRRAIWKCTQERFPMSISENSDRFSRTPETSGLLAAVRYLSANGLHWEDLHAANVMMRPSGDLVIIDVGLYGIG
jgi:predicted unusual protein kinase regulating ubiquinone biosynthesis (AarF/ABC1/UbiB family)